MVSVPPVRVHASCVTRVTIIIYIYIYMYVYIYIYRVNPGLTHGWHVIACATRGERHGDPIGISEAPLRYPHPVVGRASVGARAGCLPSHRTRVCSARRGCH